MGIKLTIGNQRTYISGMQIPYGLIDEATSYFVQGYQYTKAYRRKRSDGTRAWDGKFHLFKFGDRSIPTGLVSMVIKLLKRNGYNDINLVDGRIPPNHWRLPVKLKGITLRDYQSEAVERAIHCQRGVLNMATNAGKTEVAAGIIKCLGLRTLFINHTRALMRQSQERLSYRLDQPVGIIGDGQWDEREVTVASAKLLWTRLKKEQVQELLDRCHVVFSDECHRVGSNNWWEVLMRSGAYYRFGLSGTPFKRTDGASLMLRAATGGTIYRVTNKQLVAWGYSSEATIAVYKMYSPKDLEENGVHWRHAYEHGIVRNGKRNRIICEIAEDPSEYFDEVSPDAKVIIIIKEIEHGYRLLSRCLKNGVEAEFVFGEEDTDSQTEKLDKFKSGLRVLIASNIFEQGMDIPEIDVLVNAAGYKSSIATLQRLGRGLRKREGKDRLIMVDFADFANDYLLEWSGQRLKDYKNEDAFDIEVREGY